MASTDNASSDNIDPELVEIFIEEAHDILKELYTLLDKWSKNINNPEYAVLLQRELHTLKGGARMVNLTSVSSLAHELESLYESIASKIINPNELILEFAKNIHDFILNMIDSIEKERDVPDPNPVIAEIKEVLNGSNKSILSGFQVENSKDNFNDEDNVEPKSKKIKNEVLRVKAETLEKINYLLSENNVARVNLLQNNFHNNHIVRNLELACNHLYEYTRNLELESNKTLSLHKLKDNENSINNEFDVLEMDRYSEIQYLTHSIREVITDVIDISKDIKKRTFEINELLINQTRINQEIQRRLTDTRLISINSIVPRLEQLVKNVSKKTKKDVEFSILHAYGEMDRKLLDALVPAMEHIITNAIDHGIESVEIRKKLSKPEKGNIKLNLMRMGQSVIIEIFDDGSGLDLEAIRKKAISLGWLTNEQDVNEKTITNMILEPGFSTRNNLTQVSGRGIGLDVVRSDIKRLGGQLEIVSKKDMGTKFTITLPFTLSLNNALIFSSQDVRYGIHLSSIESITRIKANQIHVYLTKRPPRLSYHGKVYKVFYLGSVLEELENIELDKSKRSYPVLILRGFTNDYAVIVDDLIGSREVVIKALGKQAEQLEFCSGATVLADGEVVVMLDTLELSKKIFNDLLSSNEITPIYKYGNKIKKDNYSTIMVVDDSLTVRKVTKNLLEKYDYKVTLAKDGLDAIEKINSKKPDLILLDVEMPRMDGFELAKILKENESTRNIPIFMITSRTGDKHFKRAKEIGVDEYLGKPFDKNQLVILIEEYLRKHDEK